MYCFCRSWENKKIQLVLAFGLVVFGVFLEIQQASIAGADFEFEDSLANTIGIIIAYLFANLRNINKKRFFSKE